MQTPTACMPMSERKDETVGGETMTFLPVGNTTMSRRILKRCRDASLSYSTEETDVRVGHHAYKKVSGYWVPKNVSDEVWAAYQPRTDREREWVRRLDRKRCGDRKRRRRVYETYPGLSESLTHEICRQGLRLLPATTIGYQHGHGTRAYWESLGYAVSDSATSVGCTVESDEIVECFASHDLEPKPCTLTIESIRTLWADRCPTEEVLCARALMFANRHYKILPREGFYDLKDQWIRQHQHRLVSGREVRTRKRKNGGRPCWRCDGGDAFGWCEHCNGTGWYRPPQLYEHEFLIEDVRFCFHSFVAPKIISGRTAPLEVYGRAFRAEELPVPPFDLLVQIVKDYLQRAASAFLERTGRLNSPTTRRAGR